MRIVPVILLAVLLTGCGTLIPKKVELFQDKVERVPDKKAKDREIQRQAADRAAREAREVAKLASLEDGSTNLVKKSEEVALLTDAVSDSLGPPLDRSDLAADRLADKVDHSVAVVNERVERFRDSNDANAGKKIEGTGLIQVSYFAWLGGFLVLAFLGYLALKVVTILGGAANPAVGLGVNMLTRSGVSLAKSFAQVVKGCKNFKAGVDAEFTDPAVRQKILDLFKNAHNKAQDEDTRHTIDQLTKE